jgi:glycosyltransferase involved in cell wall biosynthesis
MKIAIIFSRYTELTPSGENVMTPLYTKALQKMGHSVSMYEVKSDDFNTSNWNYKFRSAFRVASGIGVSPSIFLDQEKPDLIIIQNLFPNISSNWMKSRSEPIISFVHNFRFFCAAATFFRNDQQCFKCIENSPLAGLKYRCYKNSRLATLPLTFRHLMSTEYRPELTEPQKFVVLSETASTHLQVAGIPRNKIEVVTNFIPKTIYQGQTYRNKWVYVGRLTPEKGILELLKNWPKGYSLDIYGTGPLQKEVEQYASKNSEIKLFPNLGREELLSKLPNYFGAVFPSQWMEGMPLVVLEFLNASLPVIALEGTSVTGLIKEGEAGIILSKISTQSLTQAFEEISSGYPKFRKNSNMLFESHFSESIWIEKMSSILESCAK